MTEKPPKQAGNKLRILIVFLLLLSILGALLINLDTVTLLFSQKSLPEDNRELQDKITKLEKEIEVLTEKSTNRNNLQIRQPNETRVPYRPLGKKFKYNQMTCKELDQEIQVFFTYLDKQNYITGYNLKTGAQNHFKGLLAKLFTNPPIVARETDSLFTILTNTAHFYRILGNNNVLLIKDIMIREADLLESKLALFEQWSRKADSCVSPKTEITLPIRDLYEYAGFFLNTLGGQAYLFRRNSHIRLLIRYYCVLVLDRANAEIVNRHGIDILPHLESLINEMEILETLEYRDHYLQSLRALQDKYHVYYEERDTPD